MLDKFSNMTPCHNNLNDRIISRITIVKDSGVQNLQMANSLGTKQDNSMTLGISVVQGSDNNVYVKDLMKNGPGERNGVLIGDQVKKKIHMFFFIFFGSLNVSPFFPPHHRFWL